MRGAAHEGRRHRRPRPLPFHVFFKSATGSNYASAVVSANPEASLAPLLAVRKLFLEIDNNTGGSTDLISMNELVTLCQKM